MNNVTPEQDSVRELLVSTVQSTPRKATRTRWGSRRFTAVGAITLTVTGAVAGGALSAAAFTLGGPGSETPLSPSPQDPAFTVAYIDAFEREPQAADRLPAELPDYAMEELKVDTSRFIGEHEEAAIYLVEGSQERAPVCVVVWGTPQAWVVGCGGVPMSVGGLGIPDVQVSPVGESLGDKEIRLDANVIVTE